ncbi:hypothetical protein [Aliiglaciecola litoralis]|uniref:Uncharacterized protein n=1 Tax=Aliiglaciecola litoralis TaxID=582857 RepID=A0ABN1LE16_9ALTE
MEIDVVSRLNNLSLNQLSSADSQTRTINAFGIGAANQPEVELSPQARILQQNERDQQERASNLDQNKDATEAESLTGTDFVRVSSSVGTAARNNLSTEKATEVYRSIQDLL